MKKVFLLTAIALLFFGCREDELFPDDGENTPVFEEVNEIISDKELISKLKNDAVETLVTETGSFVLEAYLWRDFMPVSPSGGKPLVAINKLISTNLIPIPDNIHLARQYVIYNDFCWISSYEDEERPQDKYRQEKISRNGPLWGPGVRVDVVVAVYDSKTQKTYFIINKDTRIIRTD